MPEIFYFPFDSETNQYSTRVKILLSNFGNLRRLHKKRLILNIIFFRRGDILVLNWFENSIIDNSGNLSFKGILKVLFCFVLFRLAFKKFIFVRHNHYPHNTLKINALKAKEIIDFLEKIPHTVVVHSPVDALNKSKHIYIPHPLYSSTIVKDSINIKNSKFVVFGRIERYKKIEHLISIFPKKLELIIAGKCSDEEYENELKNIIKYKKNIKIISKFISDDEAKKIIGESQGMLITHNDDDMIVSGSFFYAMTIGSKVFCLSTPFFDWIKKEMEENYIEVFSSLDQLIDQIALEQGQSKLGNRKKSPNQLFGDEVIIEKLKSIFEHNGNNKYES